MCVLMFGIGLAAVTFSQRMFLENLEKQKALQQHSPPTIVKVVAPETPTVHTLPTVPTVTSSGVQQVTIVPPDGLSTGPDIPYVSSMDTSYHSLGYVYTTPTEGERTTLRLYGRRKYPRSERYEYFIIDKNDIKIPFTQKNDKEIWDGDTVTIPGYTSPFTAVIYKTRELVYNPYVT